LGRSPISEAVGYLDISWPVNAIAHRFATAEKHGEGPEPLVNAEYLREVVDLAHVIRTAVGLSLFVKVLNGCLIGRRKENVEPQEHSH
jgi:hypothetical protein